MTDSRAAPVAKAAASERPAPRPHAVPLRIVRPRGRPSYTDRQIVEALQAAAGDESLTGDAYEAWTRQNAGPSRATVERRFGSWGSALVHAGIEVAPRQRRQKRRRRP